MVAAGPPSGPIPLRFELLPLGQADSQEAALVGSKAATLSRLRQALGPRVPLGWVLPARQAAILLGTDDAEQDRRAVKSLRTAIAQELGDAISASYAVRSSGLDEDSAAHSFAGQYETVLGATGADSLADAIRICVRSSRSPHIEAYRRRAGGLGTHAPAVLVQEMIPAERAGVAFTSNPVSGAAEIVVDAGYGLGDLVVGGEITPDEFGVDEHGNGLWERIGSKRRMSVLTADGVSLIPIPRALRQQASLAPDQLASIAELAILCRAELGYEADVEWAIADSTVFVLQARPMTAAAGTGPRQTR